MQMTNGEILTSYRQAKNKGKQIGILAQVNACPREKIIDILKDGGIKQQELTRNRGKNSEKTGDEEPETVEKTKTERNLQEAAVEIAKKKRITAPKLPENVEKTESESASGAAVAAELPDVIKEVITKEMIRAQEEIDRYQEEIDRHTERLRILNEYLTGEIR